MSGSHDHAIRATRRHVKPLIVVFVLVVVFMIVEAVAGWLTGSLALISDAGHMATDALGIGMAVAAIVAADRAGGKRRRTYGLYRMETLAALANATLLFAVAGYVLYEAVKRIDSPPEILTGPMTAVAVASLAVNIIAWRLLRRGAQRSLNIEGAYLEVLADLIGSLGVLLAGRAPSRCHHLDHGLDRCRCHRRRGHRSLHSAAGVAPRPQGPSDTPPGRTRAPRPGTTRGIVAGHPHRARRPRPPRMDPDLRDGCRNGASDDR